MRLRPEKRREGIISLTQTEIMLVLTVVVLLLLLLKHNSLKEVCLEAPAICDKLNVLVAQTEDGQQGGAQAVIDKDKEVTGDLIPSDGAAVMESESALVEEQQTKQEEGVEKREAELEELREENTVLHEQNLALEEKSAQSDVLPDSRDEKEQLLAENADLKKENDAFRVRDEVGFLPCWLALKGKKPRYYSTFDITYNMRNNRIKISPHRDWKRSDAAVVKRALSGKLQVLNDYPREEMGRERFLEFAQRVRSAKNAMYGGECKLAVTINKNVTGNVIKDFIIAKAGFYPVWRE